mgnify:FL=1
MDGLGAFVAVDNKYEGLIPASELTGVVDLGEEVKCRVTDVKSDGKLDLSFFEPAYKHISSDADVIMEELKNSDGFINFNDKTDANRIKSVFNMSKSSFKRAVGRLLKENMIQFYKDGIKLTSKGRGNNGR